MGAATDAQERCGRRTGRAAARHKRRQRHLSLQPRTQAKGGVTALASSCRSYYGSRHGFGRGSSRRRRRRSARRRSFRRRRRNSFRRRIFRRAILSDDSLR